MSLAARARLRHRLAGVLASMSLAAPTLAATDPPPSFQAFVLGWTVQSVCVDAAGRVIPGASPISPACPAMRSLRLGEPLPYHKHDWPSVRGPGAPDPRGQQRSDSFPARLAGQIVAVQTFDFGSPIGPRRFGQFDPGDGGQVVGADADTAAILLTQDQPARMKFFFGPHCARADSLEALEGGWILFDVRAPRGEGGARTSAMASAADNRACPLLRLDGRSDWRFADVRYRAGPGGVLTRPLRTLVTDRYADAAGLMERMYLTRELGWTRWEAWRRPVLLGPGADEIAHSADRLAASHRCDPREPGPPTSAGWRLVDCREWTNFQPSAAPGGDPPTFWLGRVTVVVR